MSLFKYDFMKLICYIGISFSLLNGGIRCRSWQYWTVIGLALVLSLASYFDGRMR